MYGCFTNCYLARIKFSFQSFSNYNIISDMPGFNLKLSVVKALILIPFGLLVEHLAIKACFFNQALVSSLFYNFTFLQNYDSIGSPNSAEPVRDDNCSFILIAFEDVIKDFVLSVGINRRSWLI